MFLKIAKNSGAKRWISLFMVLAVVFPQGVLLADEEAPAVAEQVEIGPLEAISQTSEQAVSDSQTIADEEIESGEQSQELEPAQENEPDAVIQEESQINNYLEQRSSRENKLKIEPDQATGALIYNYSIEIPPGRNGLQPDLKLTYNSQNDKNDSVLGYGWSISIPYIERQNKKGIDKLFSENYFYSSLAGELEDVFLSDGTHGEYGAKVENGDFLKYQFSEDNSWAVTDKKGKTYKFGATPQARQDNPADPAKVFKWMIEEITDLNGNNIKYEYYKDNGQIYPSKIIYTGHLDEPGIFEIEFLRATRSDNLTLYNFGFSVKTNYRISEIQAKVNGSWVKKYGLNYTAGDNGRRSMLNSISKSGRDENGNEATLPLTIFKYQKSLLSWSADSGDLPVWFMERNSGNGVLKDLGSRFAEVNGDGLIDIIHAEYDVPGRDVLINKGDGSFVGAGLYFPWSFTNGYGPLLWRLEDLNADGLIDVFGPHGAYIKNGNNGGWIINDSYNPPSHLFCNRYDCACDSISLDNGYRTADINGDGLADILHGITEPNNPENNYNDVFVHAGQNLSWQLNINFHTPSFIQNNRDITDTGVRFAEVNGDGIIDLIYADYLNNDKGVILNKGNGLWDYTNNYIFPVSLNNGSWRLGDVNSDGLIDVFSKNGAYINKGNEGEWFSADFYNPPPHLFCNQYDSACDRYGYDNGYRTADINGDGLLDILRSYKDQNQIIFNEIFLHQGKVPDLLSSVEEGEGGKIEIEYKPSTQYRDGNSNLANPKLPFIVQTVYKITTDDGLGNKSASTYEYMGGSYYYHDFFDRKFAGFGEVEKTDSFGNITKTYFHQGNENNLASHEEYDHVSKISKPYRIEIYDSNSNLFQTAINKWENIDLENERNFIKLTESVAMDYDGNASHRDKANVYEYDNANGNLLTQTNFGEVMADSAGSFADIGNDKTVSSFSYASTAGLIGLISKEIYYNQTNAKIKETNYYYDNLEQGSALKGNLTKEEKWRGGADYSAVQRIYNDYGLITEEKDPRNYSTFYIYDSYNFFPAAATNPLNHVIKYEYDYSSGKVKKTTDSNNRIFETIYDPLDRIIEEKAPNPSNASQQAIKTSYVYDDINFPRKITKINYLTANLANKEITYLDGFNRIIQERKEAESVDAYAVKDIIYNELGLVRKESLPYFSAGESYTAPTTGEALYMVYVYDPLSRPTSVSNALGVTENIYDGWKLSTVDPNLNTKNLYYDASNNLVKVEEFNNSEIYATDYNYDNLNNLIKITDANGNIKNFTYNPLGWLTKSEDLHASADAAFGIHTFTYDASGNMTKKITPKTETINFSYDKLNRLKSEDFTGQAGIEVAYVYDKCDNGKGRLCKITQSNLIAQYYYNPLGLVKKEIKTIDGTAYNTLYNYNFQGSATYLTYNDNSKIYYQYNKANLVEYVSKKEPNEASYKKIVQNIDYAPTGQIGYLKFANNTESWYTYNENALYRLTNKIAKNKQGRKLQDFSYEYDAVGNIRKIIDNSDTNTAKTTAYDYDDLYRLISAAATGAVNKQNYVQTFSYNSIGNILSKSDIGGYLYEGNQGANYANPHAVTKAGNQTLAYDRNGNLTSDSVYIYQWNYKNQLASSIIATPPPNSLTAPIPTIYDYDHEGNRIKKATNINITRYPNKYYNLTNTGTSTRQIYLGDQLVATIENNGTASSTYYVHSDHLGGSNVITDKSGNIVQLLDYYPFGDMRLNEKTGAFDEKKKFTGHEHDDETGLEYMLARYYGGKMGRFVSQDVVARDNPEQFLEDPQQLNYYSYARNNPIRFIDSTGMSVSEYYSYVTSNGYYGYGQSIATYRGLQITSAGGKTGQSNHPFQCVSFVQNFTSSEYGVNLKGTGNASAYGNLNNINGAMSRNNSAGKGVYSVAQNGGYVMPQENDIMTWLGGDYGHVGVVAEIVFDANTDEGTVYTIEQNASNRTALFEQPLTRSYNKNGKAEYTVGGKSSMNVQSWTHYDPYASCQCSAGQTYYSVETPKKNEPIRSSGD